MQITIDPELKQLIQPLSTEEYRGLEESIQADGCRDALVVWKGVLVDGHHRYQICSKHNKPFEIMEMSFENKDDVKIWMIKNQLGRRNLAPYIRGELALVMKPLIATKAERNKHLSEGRGKKGAQVSANLLKQINTRDEVAKLAGVSHDTIMKVEYIQQAGTEEHRQRAAMNTKGNTVNSVYTELKREEMRSAGITHKTCIRCGVEKPIEEFAEERNICKLCRDTQKHPKKQVDINKPISRQVHDMQTLKSIERIAADMTNTGRVIEYTVSDLEDEIQSAADYFIRNAKDCLEGHATLLQTPEGGKKIMAVLSQAEAAILEMRGFIL